MRLYPLTINSIFLFFRPLPPPPMTHHHPYRPFPTCLHTYGVRHWSCPAIATEPCRPTACVRERPHIALRPTANYSLLTANWSFTFSAKEKDTETGYSYFGSRYYSSELSIWLSVDPMADKYPSMSPYVYCANNPIKLVDPNGEEISEHIDKYGNIIAHYDDGDNSVYLHKSGTTNADISQQRIALHNTGGEGKKVGELGGTIDMMSFFENKLSQSASESKKMSIFSYYMKVKLNGDWDLKNNEKTIWGVAWKYDSDNNTNTTFSCSRFSGANAADVGNYHAGYVGTIANIPRYILCKGAGAAETWKSFKEKRYKDTAKGTIQFLNPFDLRSGDQKKDSWYNSIGMEAAKSERK